ncbi:acylphosphatase [Pontiella sulfatireligans]|uniref:acylphosphatase n=1 Tax=Pontiella sulfatireligans TaxID=2750658 RepID=A0A6C2ULH4_9BACT|nr:acylphosphatase [Pontiella sulfatireligans]VGO20154.1 Acylphosphatase [Pontiella sulfatireligans]
MLVLFSGRVQGVGFRWTVCHIAGKYQVTGFVRNLMDGDVELVAEGGEEELIDFLNAIRGSNLGRHIVRDEVRWTPARNEFSGFGISY